MYKITFYTNFFFFLVTFKYFLFRRCKRIADGQVKFFCISKTNDKKEEQIHKATCFRRWCVLFIKILMEVAIRNVNMNLLLIFTVKNILMNKKNARIMPGLIQCISLKNKDISWIFREREYQFKFNTWIKY